MSLFDTVSVTRHQLATKFRRITHRSQLPDVNARDILLLDALEKDGACATSLDLLAVEGGDLLPAADRLAVEMEQLPRRADAKSYLVSAPPELIGKYPAVIKWGLDERLLAIAENYIGMPISYRGVLARLDFADGVVDETRLWHLDQEDARILKIIVYLDDVDETGGPFEYVPARIGVPRHLAEGDKMRINDEDVLAASIPRESWRAVVGPRGTAGFADTCRIFHRGRLPTSGTRKTLFYCYNSKTPYRPTYCTPLFDPVQFIASAGSLTKRQRSAIDFPYL